MNPPAHSLPPALQRRVLIATSISYIVVVLDTSIVNIALERVAHALAADISGLQWVVNAYTLALASLLLSGGTLGDRFGARNVYLPGLALFTLASGLCGAAPNLGTLIFARALQGIGAALLIPSSLMLLNHAYTHPKEKAHAISIWASCGGVALAAGPLIGGILISIFNWRSIFLVNVPIGLAGIWITRSLPPDEKTASSRHIDLWGQLTSILGLGTLVTLLIEGPRLTLSAVLIGAAICIVAWIAFLKVEMHQSEPMLPLALFLNRVFSSATIVAMTLTLAFFGLIFVLSLYFQQVRHDSAWQTGLAFLPMTAVVAASNMLSGRWCRKDGPRWPVLIGLICLTGGFLGLLLLTSASPYWLMSFPLVLIGLGGGLVTPAVAAAFMASVEKSHSGIAAGVLNTARQTGAALGVAIFGALITAFHNFETGMHTVFWIAAVLLLFAGWVWWIASRFG